MQLLPPSAGTLWPSRAAFRIALIFGMASLELNAATYEWDDGGWNSNWSTSWNWVGNSTPPSSSNTRLDFDTGTTANNNLGTFTLNEINFGSSLGSSTFTLSGDRINFAGTHDIDINHSGQATITNNITISNNFQIRGNNGGTLLLSGDINGSGYITKFDNSTLILSGNNSFNNRTRIRGGVVESTSANALGGAEVRFEDDSGGSGAQTPTLKISNANQTFTNTLRAESGDIGYIDVDDGITFTVNGSGNAFQWDNSSSGFVKQGNGTLIIDKASSGDGTLNINDGTLRISNTGALGSSTNGTTVNSGGTLEISGGQTFSGETLTVAGTGHNGNGAFANYAGNNMWNADINLSDDATLANNASGTLLTFGDTGAGTNINNNGHTVTLDGDGDMLFNSQFTGSGGLIKEGEGTARLFYGQNDNGDLSIYTGETIVNAGTLVADLGDGTQTPLTGDITIGDGVGTDTLRTQWLNNIGDSTDVRVNSSGVLEINSATYNQTLAETIGGLTLEGGATVQTIDGSSRQASLVLNGDVTRVAAGNNTANITGRLNLGGTTRAFDVADSTAANDLNISAQVSNGSMVKNGAGTMTLSGSSSNTFSGLTVNSGAVVLDKSSGAQAVSGDINIFGGSVILEASNQISNSSDMSLGNGSFQTQGNSESLGSLTLTANSTIDLGNGGTLDFDTSSGGSWSGTLLITNWDGDTNGSGTTQILFGNNSGGLNGGQVDSIRFFNPGGLTGGLWSAKILSSGEIVPDQLLTPVPEPGTYAAGSLLVLASLSFMQRQRKQRASTKAE